MSDTVGTNATTKPEFNKFQSMFWPIHGYEMKKFLPMSFLMFFILFVYTMVRDLKDVLVQSYAVGGGTEVIPQLKFYFVLPAAFLLTMLYSKLIGKFGLTKTFYIMVSLFMSFYIIFVAFLFPNRDIIHPGAETVAAMRASWPAAFFWTIPCITNWSFTLFYILSELWGTMAISSLFWQFANKVTMKHEIKRFFGLYAIVGNIGVILSGGVLKTLAKMGGTKYVNISIIVCVIFDFAAMALYYYINNVTLKDPKLYDASLVKEKKKKEKVGAMDGIKILFKSPYLLLIAAIVLAYGAGIGFFELAWKKYMSMTFKGSELGNMYANLSMVTGILTILASFVGQNILRKAKWRTAAIITPLILASLGGVFFLLVLYGKFSSPTLFGLNVVQMAVWFGLIQDALSKSVKYCLFDSTKNMAYVPLDDETKTKGQAAVEVIGGRLGKASSSAVGIVLTSAVSAGSSITDHLVTIFVFFAAIVTGWISSVFGLSKKYEAKVSEKAE